MSSVTSMAALKGAFRKSAVMQHADFMPGGYSVAARFADNVSEAKRVFDRIGQPDRLTLRRYFC
jgi:hypothetical protein